MTTQYGMSLRVCALLVLGFIATIYLVASRTHSIEPTFPTFKTTASTKNWDDGYKYSFPSRAQSATSSNGLPAGQSAKHFEKMINDMVEAKVAKLMAEELRKRQEANAIGVNPSETSPTPPGTMTDAEAMKALGKFGKALATMANSGTAGGDDMRNPSIVGSGTPAASGIGGLLSGALSSIGGSLSLPSLGESSGALGQGLAQGIIDGLKLPKKNGVAPPPVPTGTVNAAAYNLGDSLAMTFSSQVNMTTSPDMKMLLMNVAMVVVPLAQGIGQGTAAGLGLNAPGAPPPAMLIDPNNPQPPAIAHDFSLALTQTFLGGVDLKTLMVSTPEQSAAMQQMILATLPGVGTGLGSGTAIGLGLAKPSVNASTAGPPTTPAEGAEQFTRQLSSSFLGSVDISKLIALQAAASPAAPAGPSMMNKMIGPIAEGLGRGLGEGTAVGLGLKQDQAMGPIDGTDMGLVTEALSKNLVASFLANGTATKLQALGASLAAGAPAFPPPVISKVMEGIGRGTVEGLETGLGMGNGSQDPFDDSVQGAAVGLSKGLSEASVNLVMGIIQGNPGLLAGLGTGNFTGIMNGAEGPGAPTLPASVPPANAPAPKGPAGSPPTSSGGSPAGAPKPAAGQPPSTAPAPAGGSPPAMAPAGAPKPAAGQPPSTAPAPAGGSPPAMAPAPAVGKDAAAMPLVASGDGASTVATVPPGGHPARRATILKRQNAAHANPSPSPAMDLGAALQSAGLMNLTSGLNITALTEKIVGNLNITQVNAQLQGKIDALTCTGVGGLVGLTQGLADSGTLKIDPLAPGGSAVPGLGDMKFTVYSNGNRFDFQPGLGKTSTNGILASRLIRLLAMHSILASFAIFIFFPIVIMLGSAQDVTRMLGRPQILANAPKWQLMTQLLAYLPSLIASIATGIIVIGDGPHVNTPHKIIGYILFMFGLLWLATSRAASTARAGSSVKIVNTAVVSVIFALGIIALITGWNDMATISLCLIQKASADLFVGVAVLTTSLFMNAIGVFGFVFLIAKWMGTPQTVDISEKLPGAPVSARQARHISGPFLPEARDYSGDIKN